MLSTMPGNESDAIVNSAIAEIGEIATLPEITVKIIQIVEDPKSTARDLHEVIKNDPALSARILKVVNSAFYGLPGQIASVDRAIVLLGLSAVKNIAIAASMTRLFQGGTAIEGFNGLEVWRHSISVGVACRMITTAQGKPSVEEAFLAGLIHDLGLLVERQAFGRKIGEVIARHKLGSKPFWEVEAEVIGTDHQLFGMALANKWRFPRALCTAIGYHHRPTALANENLELPAIVHIADILACRAQIGFSATAYGVQYTSDLLDVIRVGQEKIDEMATDLPEQVAAAEAIFRG